MKLERCWAIALVMGGLLAVTITPVRASTTSADMQSGVHVCASVHYKHADVICTRDDSRMAYWRLKDARLAYAAKGDTFTSPTTTIIVSHKHHNGSWNEIGRTTVDTSLAAGLESVSLAWVFAQIGAQGAATYQIEVDNGSTLLGTRTVTFVK